MKNVAKVVFGVGLISVGLFACASSSSGGSSDGPSLVGGSAGSTAAGSAGKAAGGTSAGGSSAGGSSAGGSSAGGSSAGGSSAGGSSGGDCTNGGTGDCMTCTTEAQKTCCMTESAACGANKDCVAFNNCLNTMKCMDQACAQTCATASPNGVNDYLALLDCIFGDEMAMTVGACGTICQ